KNYRTTCENILLLLSVILRHHTPVNISLPPRRISPVSKLYPIHTPEDFSALLRKISPVYPGRFLRLIDKVIDHTIDPPPNPPKGNGEGSESGEGFLREKLNPQMKA
ncbi:TPA: hypothetical protein ACIYSJ_005320, partial [Escherichia coli]